MPHRQTLELIRWTSRTYAGAIAWHNERHRSPGGAPLSRWDTGRLWTRKTINEAKEQGHVTRPTRWRGAYVVEVRKPLRFDPCREAVFTVGRDARRAAH